MRKVPLRKCAACGLMKEKKDLVRIVKADEGHIEVDETGKKNGRGAYLCRSPECLAAAGKKRALERSLKCGLPPGFYDDLRRRLYGG